MKNSIIIALMLGVTLAAGCGDSSGPDQARLKVSFAAAPATGSTSGLQIDSVLMLVWKLKLEKGDVGAVDCDAAPGACEDFETGKYLLRVGGDGRLVSPFGAEIRRGVFKELELEIKRADQAFVAGQPGWPLNASIRVKGRFNGQAYDIFLDAEPDLELDLAPDYVVGASAGNLTVRIDVASWFRVDGATIDPRSVPTNSTLRSKVEDNVKKSFDAFGDDDENGARG